MSDQMTTDIVGTPRWTAPEIYESRNRGGGESEYFSIYDEQHSPYTEKSDVYSFGIILWEIVAREVKSKKKNFSSS